LLVRWMRTIYLSTLNWADKEFFLIFLYIASLEQAWQNPSNTNPRVGLRALISPTRSNINPRVGFELLSETRLYDHASYWSNNSEIDELHNDWRDSRSNHCERFSEVLDHWFLTQQQILMRVLVRRMIVIVWKMISIV
jgi:hypothetical protein